MLLKVYKSRAWLMLLMLLPFLGTVQAQESPWGFTNNPTSATYAITTSVMFDGVDALAAGDWVGAFYMDNGVLECGGAIQWTGTANTAVVAFGNDTLEAPNKNGFSEGEMVHWKFYRSATSTEVEVLSTPEFFWTNGFLGEVTAFSPAVPPEVCQDINLVTGTRIISTYIQPADLNFKNVMTDILDNLKIAKNSAGAQLRKIGPNWVNNIGNLVTTEGYSMTMNAPDLLTICGEKIPFDTPIPVVGTKLVSYLHINPMNAVTAFGTILDNLKIAKNSTGAQLRKIGPNWVNSIGNLNAGEGYLVVMNAADEIIYPAAADNSAGVSAPKNATRSHYEWLGGNATELYWNMYIDEAMFNGMALEAGDEIAIFDGDLIVGVRILEETPMPGTFNEWIPAFSVLGDLSPGYTIGNTPTFKCWDASEEVESESFTIDFLNPYGDAWSQNIFPGTADEYSIIILDFNAGSTSPCPELISAEGGLKVVNLEWAPAIPVTPTNNSVEKSRGHYQWLGGNATELYWNMYIDEAMFNGMALEAGDEIAIFDGDLIVGVRILEETPMPGTFNEWIPAFSVLGDLSPGYTIGNTPTFKCWDASEEVESESFTIDFLNPYGDAWSQNIFPGSADEYSIIILNFGLGFTPTFNVYYEDGTLVEANVEGTTYQVTGLEDGTEYCFYVTENLEGGVESCQSNVLCATTDPGCEDVVINNFPAAPADVCFGEAVVIDFSGVEVLNAVSVEWTIDPVEAGVFDGLVFNLDTEFAGMVTITVFGEAAFPCADATMSLSFEVFALPVVTCPADFGVCYTVEPFALTGATPEGGEYSGAGVIDGVFDPGFGSIGENEITYTYTDDNGCSNSCTFYITLYDLPEVICPVSSELCIDVEAFMLTGAEPIGGEYTGVGVADGMFDPMAAGVGAHVITYTYLDVETGCSNWCEFTITVNPLPEVTCPEYAPVCLNSTEIVFPEVAGGWYQSENGDEVTSFNPTEVGIFNFALNVTNEFGCENYCLFSIEVMPLPVVECPEFEAVCAGSEMIEFAAVEGGVYTNEALEVVTGFDPVEAGVYAFTLTVTDEFGCEGFCDFNITVLESVVVYAGADATILIDESYTIFDATVLNSEIVVWTTYGDGTFDDNTQINPTYFPGEADILAGQVTLSLLGDGDCPDVDTMVLTIGESPCTNLADAGEDMTVCADGEAIQLDGYVENAEMFFWSTMTGMGEFSDENILNPTYTPGEGDYLMGSVELCLTATGVEPCPDVVDCMTITFNALPIVTLVAYEPVCEGSEAFDLYGGLPEGGTYFVDGLEAVTFNPEMAGEYDLMYTYTDDNGCTNSAMGTIMVLELPEVSLVAYAPVCEGSEAFDLYGGLPEGGTYFVDGLEAVTFNPVMAGEYELMYMYIAENGCTNFAMGSIVVNPLPVVECPVIAPVCEGSEMIEFPEVEGGIYYDVTSAPVLGFDPIMAGNYDFMLEVTNEFGCSASCDFTIVVNPLPYLIYEPAVFTMCLGEVIDVTVTGPEDGAYPYAVELLIDGEVMTDVIGESYNVYQLEPEVAGTFTLEVISVTDANGCVALENSYFEVEILPLTAITTQPMDVEVVYGQPFELSVVAENATGYQWYFEGEMIAGATTDTYAVEAALLADDGTYYVMVFGECGDVMSAEVTVTVTPETQIIDFLGAVNGMSTFLDLIDPDMLTIFDNVLDDLYYVEMKNPVMVWTPANATFNFNENKGAKAVLNSGWPTSIEVVGYPTLGTTVSLPVGSSYLPVHSRDAVSAAEVFEPLGTALLAVYSMDFSGIYWPSYGVYTLQNLLPGSAYLVVMTAPGVVDFDVPALKTSVAKYTNVPTNLTSWQDMVLTATQHNIAITADALSGLQIGDVIGAFNEYGQIAGMVEVTSLKDNLVLRAFGDNPATEAVEGFVEGDLITFKVWRNGVEIAAEATFTANMPNQNVFAKDGISAVEGLKAGVTAVEDLSTEFTANLYPNPATDVVNINTNFVISNVKVINYVGQVIFESNPAQEDFQINTSNLVSGMYFVQIESSEGYVITKRLTIK